MKLRKVEHVLNSENKIYSKLKRSKKNTCFKLTNIQRIEHIQKLSDTLNALITIAVDASRGKAAIVEIIVEIIGAAFFVNSSAEEPRSSRSRSHLKLSFYILKYFLSPKKCSKK